MTDLETIGKLYSDLQAEKAFGDTLLGLVANMLRGAIDPSRVLVNLTDRTVAWEGEGQRPGLPAIINGRPDCVVQVGLTRAEMQLKIDALLAMNAELKNDEPRTD